MGSPWSARVSLDLALGYSTATVTVFDVTPYTAIDTGTELPDATPSGT